MPNGRKVFGDYGQEDYLWGTPPEGVPEGSQYLGDVDIGGSKPLYKSGDGKLWYGYDGKQVDWTPEQVKTGLENTAYDERLRASQQHSNGFDDFMAKAIPIGILVAGGFAAAGLGPFAAGGIETGVAAATETAATGIGAGAASSAVGGGVIESAVDTFLPGAVKGAAVNAVGQVVTTGTIDPGKVLTGAVSGGFGQVISGAVGGGFMGTLAGAAGAGIIGSVIGGKKGAITGAVSGGVGAVGAPAVNDVGFNFKPAELKFNPAARNTDWSTPRLNWNG